MIRTIIYLLCISALFAGCKKTEVKQVVAKEDTTAKKLLQGIWLNSDDGEPVFRMEGDTIYYPDSTSQPSYFRVVADTLFVKGAHDVKYPIVRQSENLFEFKSPNGEQLTLVKSEDKDDIDYFEERVPIALNQRQLIKRDTIVVNEDTRYHCYVQVNPTTYKVVKAGYSDEGFVVDNVYYDNIVHLSIFNGAKRLFTHDFRKQDFSKLVPADFMKQCVLSDIILVKADSKVFHYQAMMGIPDTLSSFIVSITVGYDGKMTQRVND